MSYSIGLHIDTGGPKSAYLPCDLNITWNLKDMWYKALDGTDLGEEGIRGLDGRAAGECVAALRTAISRMEDDPDAYKELNPSNGWGDYDWCLDFFRGLREVCVAHPKTVISVH